MLIECPNCSFKFEANVLSEYSTEGFHDPIDAYKYTFSSCEKCEIPLLIEQERGWNNGVGLYWSNPKIIYPNSEFHINPVIPEILRQSLFESINCYQAKSYTATTIMCRRTIEGFCFLKNIQEKNLAISIEKLKEKGIINDQLYEWANELRLVGNEAAHNINIKFTPIDAKDALDFTIAILDYTYSFKEKFDKFKNRRRTNK